MLAIQMGTSIGMISGTTAILHHACVKRYSQASDMSLAKKSLMILPTPNDLSRAKLTFAAEDLKVGYADKH